MGLKDDKQALEQRIENHIKDEVGATRGMISERDVVNEPFTQHELLDLLGPGIMTEWFKLAHEGDPKAMLYLNDFAGLMNRGENTPHKDALERTLRMLQDSSAPVGGLGIQAHFSPQLTGPRQILQELDRWARLGLAIQITEFDVNVQDEQLQAQYTRDFMTSVFSHPAVNAILMWGFWEGAHWIPQAALYRKDWEIKPNGKAWNELVLKEWHTQLTAITDTSGCVSIRGFRGDYDITINYKGRQKTWPLALPKQGAELTAVVN